MIEKYEKKFGSKTSFDSSNSNEEEKDIAKYERSNSNQSSGHQNSF